MGFRAHFVKGYAEAFQHAGGHALALPQEADQQMFGTYIGMVHPPGFVYRQFDHFLGAGREADFALRRLFAAADDEFNGGTDFRQVNGKAGQHPGGYPFRFADQAEEDMLSADVVVVKALGFLLGQRQNPPRPLGKLLEPAAHNSAPGLGEVLGLGVRRRPGNF